MTLDPICQQIWVGFQFIDIPPSNSKRSIMVNLHPLKLSTLFLSPFLLACAGSGWRTVEAQFRGENVEIATCSSGQIERCEEIKTRLEAGETVTILDPEYVRFLAIGKEWEEWEENAIAQSSLALFNTISPTEKQSSETQVLEKQNEWIAEVWVEKDDLLNDFESLFSLPPNLAIDLAISSIYKYAMMFGSEYSFDFYDDREESLINAFLEIHRQKRIRYTGPLTIGQGSTGTRGCSVPVDDILERQFSHE